MLAVAVGGKGAENGRGCVHVQRRLPALSAAPQATDFDRQRHGLRMPDCFVREVPPALLSQMNDKGTVCGCRAVTSGRCVARPAPLALAH